MSNERYGEEDASYNPYSMSSTPNSSYVRYLINYVWEAASNGMSSIVRHWKVLLFGQTMSFCLATSGAASSELFLRCELNAPTFQFGLMYFMLSFHLLPIIVKDAPWKRCFKKQDLRSKVDEWNLDASIRDDDRKEDNVGSNEQVDSRTHNYRIPILNTPIKGPIGLYSLMAVMDIEANFLTILAFRYTSLTSITLLDSLAIPGAMVASKIILKCKYRASHVIGALICIAGTVLNVLSDYREEEEEIEEGDSVLYPNELRGDLLAALGGILYGVNDTVAEYLVKNCDVQEYIGFTGFVGFLVSIIQACVFERDQITEFFDGSSNCNQGTIVGFMLLFLIANYISFTGISRFLIVSEAALLNLSLLTGDLYAVLFSIFGEHVIPQPLFFVAMVFIISGVFLYESVPTPTMAEIDANTTSLRRDSDFSDVNENFVTMNIEMNTTKSNQEENMVT